MKKYLVLGFLIACSNTPKNSSTTGGSTGGATGGVTSGTTGGASTGSSGLASTGSTGLAATTAQVAINNTEFWCNVVASVAGTQVASLDSTKDTLSIEVAIGATIDLTASPSATFEPVVWTGATTTDTAHATYVVTDAAGQSVTADCALPGVTPVPSHTLTLLSADNTDCPVTATPLLGTGQSLISTLSFQEGTVIVLSATSITGATFSGFTGTDTDYPNEITMSADESVTLSCTPPVVGSTIALTINNDEGWCYVTASVAGVSKLGSSDLAPIIDVAPNTQVDLTASPVDGMEFDPAVWTGATAGSDTAHATYMTTTDATQSISVDCSDLVAATPETLTLGAADPNCPITATASGSLTSAALSTPLSFVQGTLVDLTTTPAAGFTVSSWTGTYDNNPAAPGTATTVTMSAAEEVSVTCVGQSYTLTLARSPPFGTLTYQVNGTDGTGSSDANVKEGDVISVSFVDATNYPFTGWTISPSQGLTSGSLTSCSAPLVFSMPANNVTVTAEDGYVPGGTLQCH